METIQRRLIRPKKLIHVAPFNVVLLWSNGDIRLNDFAVKIEEWKVGANKQLIKLADPAIFMSAMIHNNALAFKKVKFRIPGLEGFQLLDLDPDVMFQESTKLGRVVTSKNLIKKWRVNQGSSKFEIEIKSIPKEGDVDTTKKIYHFNAVRYLLQVDDELIEMEN